MLVQADQQVVGRRRLVFAKARGRGVQDQGAPFIGVDGHGLGQVQRVVFGVDRDGDDAGAQGDVGRLQPRALAAEQQAGLQAGCGVVIENAAGLARGAHGLARLARAGGGGEDGVQVGDGLGDGREHPHPIQHPVGAGRRSPGPLLRPAVARADQAQVRQAEVGHDPRHGADILGHLRLVENDGGGSEVGHGRCLTPQATLAKHPSFSSSSGKPRSGADRGTQRRAKARTCREPDLRHRAPYAFRLRRRWVPRSRYARRRMTKARGLSPRPPWRSRGRRFRPPPRRP